MKPLVKIKQFIWTRLLPKTGQTTSYQGGDDGYYQLGWWDNNNSQIRFIPKTYNGDDVVIDKATGLMWAADGNAAGCNNGNGINWSNAIVYANALTFAGFNNWRVPNSFEIISIINHGRQNPAIDEPPFVNTVSGGYWSSTTRFNVTTKAHRINFSTGYMTDVDKTILYQLRCVKSL